MYIYFTLPLFLYNDINNLELSSPTLYPNPANDHAIINGIPKGSAIQIFDLSGRLTYLEGEWNSTGNQFTINTSRLSASIYFVDVEFQRQHVRMKLAVER
ncbi:MAG: T9SS type A sorting domain-containing protein [Bacteroidetes bacterium]|nr:T9SS type A sorting domain-containing protein [Bacteroidota bacterium]